MEYMMRAIAWERRCRHTRNAGEGETSDGLEVKLLDLLLALFDRICGEATDNKQPRPYKEASVACFANGLINLRPVAAQIKSETHKWRGTESRAPSKRPDLTQRSTGETLQTSMLTQFGRNQAINHEKEEPERGAATSARQPCPPRVHHQPPPA